MGKRIRTYVAFLYLANQTQSDPTPTCHIAKPVRVDRANAISFKPYFYDQCKVVELFNPPMEELPYFFNPEYFEAAVANPAFDSWYISRKVYETDILIRIIQGRHDPVNGTEAQLNERAQNSKLIYFERAGHFPWVDQPEVFFDALIECLKE